MCCSCDHLTLSFYVFTVMILDAINRSNLLDEINADGFSPRQFTSGGKRDEYPIVVDLASQPSVPTPVQVKQDPKTIFHSSVSDFSQCCVN